MDFFYLLTSILGESSAYVVDKINFKKNHIGFRHMMFLSFLGMTAFLGLFVFFARPPLPSFTPMIILLVGLTILFSFGGNVFDALSLKADDLSLREPLVDFYPILAGLVGYAVYPAQRKTPALIAFLVGTLIIRWGIHRIKLRRIQKKGIGYLILAISLYSVLPSLYQESLKYISPAYVALFRVTGILFLTSMFLPFKNIRGFTPKRVAYGLTSCALASVATIAGLYAISAYGVVLTMLFMMLGPAFRYLASQFILHEKVRRVEVISSVMLTLVVAVAAFVK